jgi:hypothetical protein
VKPYLKQRALVLSLLAVVLIPLAAKALCRCPRGRPSSPVDTRGWGLREFVAHLDAGGLPLRVVASRADGKWADNVYLTADPDADWHTFQLKNQSPERLSQWWGAVWLHRIGPATVPESRLAAWEGRGCRIDDFLLFGDPTLIERIVKLFPGQRMR